MVSDGLSCSCVLLHVCLHTSLRLTEHGHVCARTCKCRFMYAVIPYYFHTAGVCCSFSKHRPWQQSCHTRKQIIVTVAEQSSPQHKRRALAHQHSTGSPCRNCLQTRACTAASCTVFIHHYPQHWRYGWLSTTWLLTSFQLLSVQLEIPQSRESSLTIHRPQRGRSQEALFLFQF